MIVWLFKKKAEAKARKIARHYGPEWNWQLHYMEAINELLRP